MEKSIIEEIKRDTENVPFGNSQFQNEKFSSNQETPERKYRHALLQMDQKINALKECEFRRRRLEIDIRELEEKRPTRTGFELDRIDIDIEEKQWALNNEIKLINDAIIEVGTFYKIYKELKAQLPTITRESFEAAECGYWKSRLTNEATREALCDGRVSTGTMQSLLSVDIIVGRDAKGRIAFSDLVNKREELRLVKPE